MRDSVRQKTSRDAILDATDQLLAENGYKKMTIDDLAKKVGIGKGSVYLHFESKEEIALSHIDRIIERLKTRLLEIKERRGSCEKRLRLMLIERVLYRFDSVQHYSRSLNEMLAQLRPRLLERRKKYFEDEASIFASLIAEGVASGVFSAKKPQQAATALLDATNSLLPYSLSAVELGHRAEVERRVNALADVLLNGVMK